MTGIIVNTSAIIIGSFIGTFFHKFISESKQKIMFQGIGLCAMALGITWIVNGINANTEPVLFMASIVIGGLIGESLKIDDRITRLSEKRNKNSTGIVEGLTTAFILFCLGTLSILGPIKSALEHDNTMLFTNAMLDGITSMILASTFGLGMIFAAVLLFTWQGTIYLLAQFLEPFVTSELMTQISLIGGILILSTGLSILKIKKIKTINFLPALLIPIIYFNPIIYNFLHSIFSILK
jgi:uncharacterized membrane protein YqgA involved in biofilm formation